MKRFFAFAALLTAVLTMTAGCSSLIEPERLPCDITVEQLQQKMNDAMDPKGNYRNAKSYAQRVIVNLSTWYGDTNLKMEVFFMKPNIFRFDYFMDNKLFTTMIYNGTEAFTIDYNKKEITRMNHDQFTMISRFVSLGQPDTTYTSLFPKIELNECLIKGKPYYWMRCYFNADSSGNPYDVFVSKDDYLTRRIQFYTKATGDYTAIINTYTREDDVVQPDTFTSEQDGYSQNFDLIRYKLDPPLTEKDFALPNYPIKDAE